MKSNVGSLVRSRSPSQLSASELPRISLPKLSEKGYERPSEHVFGPIQKPKWAEEPLFCGPEGYTLGASETFQTVSPRTRVNKPVVGAFFGVKVGAVGKEKAEAARERSEQGTKAALSMLPPESAEQLRAEMNR